MMITVLGFIMEGHPRIIWLLLRISILMHSFPLGDICSWVVWLWTSTSYLVQCKDVSCWCLLKKKKKRKICLVNNAMLWGFHLSSMGSRKKNFPTVSHNLMCVFWVLWSFSRAEETKSLLLLWLGRVHSLSSTTFSGIWFMFSCRRVWG